LEGGTVATEDSEGDNVYDKYILSKFHGPLAGHHGVRKTVEWLRKSGRTWPNMSKDVADYIAKCVTCSKMKHGREGFKSSLGTTMAEQPFEVMSLDLVGPLTEDASHKKYILVMVDHFSRYSLLRALPDKAATTVALAILETLSLFGIFPRMIRTDHGSEFTAKLTSEILGIMGEHQTTVTDHPESNGMVERKVQEVMKHLRCLAADRELSSHWSAVLPLVQRIVNVTPNKTTGFSPMRIVFGTYGQDSPYPFRGSHGEGQASATDLVQFLMDSQKRISEGALENQQQYLDSYLRNSPVGPTTLAAGDLVLAQHRGETPPSKLAPRLRGPYVIVERTGTNRYSANTWSLTRSLMCTWMI
jgi:hypothetical protein